MSAVVRTGLATITIVGLAAVAVRLRFRERFDRWEEAHQHWFFDGAVGRIVARYYAPLGAWLYAAYAKGLGLRLEDEVLDVACGSGVFLAKHAPQVRRIAGLDQSQAMVDQALRENAERIADGTAEFVVGDVGALPWDDDTFTVVTSNDVSCYVSKAPSAIKEMYRVLKPGGRAVVGEDRREMLEVAGFSRVSVRRVMLMHLTTGYKE